MATRPERSKRPRRSTFYDSPYCCRPFWDTVTRFASKRIASWVISSSLHCAEAGSYRDPFGSSQTTVAQKLNRRPSCTSRFANADVKPCGWLGPRLRCPLSPKGGAITPTTLFTLPRFVRLRILNPSAVSWTLALSPSLNARDNRMSKLTELGPMPVLRPAPGGRSLVECRSLLTFVPASKLKGCALL